MPKTPLENRLEEVNDTIEDIIEDCNTILQDKGAPTVDNLADLPSAIENLSGGGGGIASVDTTQGLGTRDIVDPQTGDTVKQVYVKPDGTTIKFNNNGQLQADIKTPEFIAVAELPTASAQTMGNIYLVPSPSSKTRNVKDEYITIQSGNSYEWEQIGTTAIDLSNYYTKQEIATVGTTGDYEDLLNKPTIPPGVVVDSAISSTSENPVQNKVIEKYLEPILGAPVEAGSTDVKFTFDTPIHTTQGNDRLLAFVVEVADDVYRYVEIVEHNYPDNLEAAIRYTGSSGSYSLGILYHNPGPNSIYAPAFNIYVYAQDGTLVSSDSYNYNADSRASIPAYDTSVKNSYWEYNFWGHGTGISSSATGTPSVKSIFNVHMATDTDLFTYTYNWGAYTQTNPCVATVSDINVYFNDNILTPWDIIKNKVEGAPNTVDTELSTTSTNPVQNKLTTIRINEVRGELNGIIGPEHLDAPTVNFITSNSQLPPTYDFASDGYTEVMVFAMQWQTQPGYNPLTDPYNVRLEIGFKFNEGEGETSLSNVQFYLQTWADYYGGANDMRLLIAPTDGNSHTMNISGLGKMYYENGTSFTLNLGISTFNFNTTFNSAVEFCKISWGGSSGYSSTTKLATSGYYHYFAELSSPQIQSVLPASTNNNITPIEWPANFTFNGKGTPIPWVELQNKVKPFTGATSTVEDIESVITTGANITNVSVVTATFKSQYETDVGSALNNNDKFIIKYDGTDWKVSGTPATLDNQTISLIDYGITITGTPATDDVLTFTYIYEPAADGVEGLVPPPHIADKNKYLKGDGTWSEINTPSVTVDSAMSSTSENPVQNKVIASYLAPVFGTIPDPSQTPVNYVFANEPLIHSDATLACFYGLNGNDYKYVEIITKPTTGYEQEYDTIDFGLCYYGDSLYTTENIMLYTDTSLTNGAHFDLEYYVYNQSGNLIGSKTETSRTAANNTNGSKFFILDTGGSYYSGRVRGNYVSLYVGEVKIGTGRNDVSGSSITTTNFPNSLNYTINGNAPKSPFVQLGDRVTTLESRENIRTYFDTTTNDLYITNDGSDPTPSNS